METEKTEVTAVAPEVVEAAVVAAEVAPKAPEYVKISVATMRKYAIAFALGLFLVVLAFLFSKGYFVAATVNGSPISRFAVINELEKQGGKTALESLINEKLVKSEIAKSNVTLAAGVVEAKIKEIEAQVAEQGGTLPEILESEGMTMDQLTEQITTQMQLEEILKDKLVVTEEEIAAFIEENQITLPKDMSQEDFSKGITEQLKQQKFATESQTWVAGVTEAAKIKYYVTY